MSLRDEVTSEMRAHGPRCTVSIWLAEQSEADEWRDLLDDPTVQTAALHRTMRKHGFERAEETVKRHRRRVCNCAESA